MGHSTPMAAMDPLMDVLTTCAVPVQRTRVSRFVRASVLSGTPSDIAARELPARHDGGCRPSGAPCYEVRTRLTHGHFSNPGLALSRSRYLHDAQALQAGGERDHDGEPQEAIPARALGQAVVPVQHATKQQQAHAAQRRRGVVDAERLLARRPQPDGDGQRSLRRGRVFRVLEKFFLEWMKRRSHNLLGHGDHRSVLGHTPLQSARASTRRRAFSAPSSPPP
jgi:hypothetical protein